MATLIHNPLKYTEAGGVSVTGQCEIESVRFMVADTGAGIATDDLQRVFEMFQQANHQPPRGGGVGLGLYIVKRFTDVLGGDVSVDSRPGEGACFTVTLPTHGSEPL